jgi:hypothetical protein
MQVCNYPSLKGAQGDDLFTNHPSNFPQGENRISAIKIKLI